MLQQSVFVTSLKIPNLQDKHFAIIYPLFLELRAFLIWSLKHKFGENSERPDLVGSDRNNDEVLLCEAKFWAGLTKNQLLTYLERLRKNKSSSDKALVFICPEARIISLWGELTRIINGSGVVKSDESQELKRVKVNGVLMTIVSWRAIVNILMQVLSAEHSPMVADCNNYKSFVKRWMSMTNCPYRSMY